MRKRDHLKNAYQSLRKPLQKGVSRAKSFTNRKFKRKSIHFIKLSNNNSNENPRKSLRARVSQRCKPVYVWCKNHPRVIISGTTIVVIITVVSIPESRLFLSKVPKSVVKMLNQTSEAKDLDLVQTTNVDSMNKGFLSSVTIKKCVVSAGLLIFTIFVTKHFQSSSDLEDAGEAVSFMFEDSFSGEGVTFVTKDSISNNKISLVSITSVLTTGVSYVGSAGASVVAYANSALLARLGLPVLNANDSSGFGSLLIPVNTQLDWLLSSRPWKFVIHQRPIMSILKLIGFGIPKFGPYPLSELIMYHPSFNIYSDVSQDYSIWNWGTWIKYLTLPTDEAGELISPLILSLLWDDNTLDDLGSLHPYLARFLQE